MSAQPQPPVSPSAAVRRLAAPDIAARKGGEPIVCLTAYTAPMAAILDEACDLLLEAPHTAAALVQQLHITAAHIVCALVEREMFPVNAAR